MVLTRQSSTHNIANTTGMASLMVEEPEALLTNRPQGFQGRDGDVDVLISGSPDDVGES
jgi:hypothetical protein